MYRYGHYGAALLVYSPLAALTIVLGFDELALLGGLAAVGLSMAPDVDIRLPGVRHRGPTHTVAFAVLIGAGVAALVGVLATGETPLASMLPVETTAGVALTVVFAFLVGTLSVLSHILADALTPMGVTPFWPASSRHYSYSITRAANPLANYALFGIGVIAAIAAASLGSLP